jgi:uncharacterized protein
MRSLEVDMTANKKMVTRYMDAFGRSDHREILSCLTEDVAWEVPGGFQIRGKKAFDEHIEDEDSAGSPLITVTRLTEENNVVIAEGSVRAGRKDGTVLNLVFCDVFEMQGGLIRRLISYLMETK